MNDLEMRCRLAYGAYTYLRDHAIRLSNVSGTARRLAEATDATPFLARAAEELEELRGVIAGTHDDPLVLEASQVWYWCCLAALADGLTYDDWTPHESWTETSIEQDGEHDGQRAAPTCKRLLDTVGAAVRETLAPCEAVEFDVSELRTKAYLAVYFRNFQPDTSSS